MNRTPNMARPSKGFTLIELMIVIAVLSVIMLIIFMIFIGMIRSTRMMDAKVKMRDEARTGLSHITRNLRMADRVANPGQLQYTTPGGTVSTWPPAGGTFVDNITFRRPIDSDNDGTPYLAGTTTVDWSTPVTLTLDKTDANGDGDTLQLVQLDNNGNFMRLLISDISPVVNSGGSGSYDTPAVGGVAFSQIDLDTIRISIIQRRQLGSGMPTIASRYDDFVTVRN